MKFEKRFPLDTLKDEFRVWTQLIKPILSLPENVLNICEYGFTETLNNVIDHSEGENVVIKCEQDDVFACFELVDDGVGIFSKLRHHFSLDSDVHALIELVKGKLTVAPDAHSGEGLFFASKMFDCFTLESGELIVVFENDLCTVTRTSLRKGTMVRMKVANNSQRIAEHVFNRFCDTENLIFYKTRFLLLIASLEGNLVSRSQAKRVATRFESFAEVELDFTGVEKISQAFADELFRVWPIAHTETKLIVTNASEAVLKMISHVKGRTDLPQPLND